MILREYSAGGAENENTIAVKDSEKEVAIIGL